MDVEIAEGHEAAPEVPQSPHPPSPLELERETCPLPPPLDDVTEDPPGLGSGGDIPLDFDSGRDLPPPPNTGPGDNDDPPDRSPGDGDPPPGSDDGNAIAAAQLIYFFQSLTSQLFHKC